MAGGFQARLDEMLRSRQAQVQRLNEEMAVQARKRLLVEQRKAGLRRVQQRILALKLGLCKMELRSALGQDEVRRLETTAGKLEQEYKDVALGITELEQQADKNKADDDYPCKVESIQDLRKSASELRETLEELERRVEAAGSEHYLAGVKAEIAAQVRDNEKRWREAGEATQLARTIQRLQQEIQALQLDNQALESQLLVALHHL